MNGSIDGAFLDGTEHRVLLPHKSQDDFVNVTGLVYYNQLFTWTTHTETVDTCFADGRTYTKDNMYVHEGGDDYRESNLFACADGFHGLDVFHPSYQPFPAPSGPPADLRVLFLDTVATVAWTEPQRLDAIGKSCSTL